MSTIVRKSEHLTAKIIKKRSLRVGSIKRPTDRFFPQFFICEGLYIKRVQDQYSSGGLALPVDESFPALKNLLFKEEEVWRCL